MENFIKKYGKVILITVLSLILGVDQAMEIGAKIAPEEVGVIEAGETALAEALKPIISEIVQEELKPIIEKQEEISTNISLLNQQREKEITSRAVAAYSKVFTIEDLKNSPEKKTSIELGLQLESCKEILMSIDLERTQIFYNYLFGT